MMVGFAKTFMYSVRIGDENRWALYNFGAVALAMLDLSLIQTIIGAGNLIVMVNNIRRDAIQGLPNNRYWKFLTACHVFDNTYIYDGLILMYCQSVCFWITGIKFLNKYESEFVFLFFKWYFWSRYRNNLLLSR